jgi:breast cancer 2 susceptibility protein
MVLCVSAIVNSPVEQLADGTNAPDCQSLELTDGWYIIRANIDAPICRALKKGKLRLGYKIAISGAKVCMQGMNAQ